MTAPAPRSVWELAGCLAAARSELRRLSAALAVVEDVPGLRPIADRLRPRVAALTLALQDEHEALTARRW
jgi:hypothetical protein